MTHRKDRNVERRKGLLARWGPIVDCIADLFGQDAEVVLHDASRPAQSVIKIRNGHITGREVGAPLTDLGFFMLRQSRHRIDTLGVYAATTPNGQPLRCNAANLRDERGEIEAILCINLHESKAVRQTSELRPRHSAHALEHFEVDISKVVARVVSTAMERGNGEISRADRLALIRDLDDRGIFLARGAVRLVGSRLGIASPTVYKYLTMVRRSRQRGAKPA